jgi:AGZA family xanthine/uracil permease-like MFS transporter
MRLIPKSVKVATVAGMGLQVALVGMTIVDIVVANPDTIVGLGPLDNYRLWFTVAGLILIGSLLFHQLSGSILLGIIIITIVTWIKEGSYPTSYIEFPSIQMKTSELINFSDIDVSQMAAAVVAFVFIGIVDVGAVTFGMASLANITESDGTVPGSLFSFLGCGIGTMIGAMTGSTPVIVYCETAAGIKEGSRTGLTAVVVGFFFIMSLFLAPVFSQVPTTATAAVSILVGAMMMSQAALIDWNDMSEAVPAFLTMVIMPFTFSITNGIVFGLASAFCFSLTTGNFFKDIKACMAAQQPPRKESFDELTGLNEGGPSAHSSTHSSPVFHPERTLVVHDHDVVRTPALLITKQESRELSAAHGYRVDDYRHHVGHFDPNTHQCELENEHSHVLGSSNSKAKYQSVEMV